MDKIHFDQLNFKNNKLKFLLLVISLIVIVLNIVGFYENYNPAIGKFMNVMAFLTLAIINSKMFWYKNFVQWNRKGITIKINQFLSKSLNFNEITKFDVQNNQLIITKSYGENKVINMKNIETESVNKLLEILKENT